jgi:hypothetical protein
MHPSILLGPFLATAVLAGACTPQEPAIEVDPQVGRECFDTHSASLPAGSQYEGIERAVAGRVSIRVMTGVDLKTLDCRLDPDGSLKRDGQ